MLTSSPITPFYQLQYYGRSLVVQLDKCVWCVQVKNNILRIVVFLIGLLLLNLIAWLYSDIYSSSTIIKRIDVSDLYKFSLITFLFLLFGILIEWKRIPYILSKEAKVDKLLLISSVILIVVSMIPFIKWVQWFGYSTCWTLRGLFLGPIQSEYIKNSISILAGILLIRSLTRKD